MLQLERSIQRRIQEYMYRGTGHCMERVLEESIFIQEPYMQVQPRLILAFRRAAFQRAVFQHQEKLKQAHT